MERTFKNKILTFATFLLCVFAPLSSSGVTYAHALSLSTLLGGGGGERVTIVGDVSTVGITNTLKNTLSEVSNAFIAGIQSSLRLKEFTLDGIARSVAQSALNQLTADMVSWINGGFDGEPAFVTNLDEFMLRVRDETAGAFIYGSELDNLCEPVEFKVKAALVIQYTQEGRGTYTPQCTVSQVAGADVNAFIEGDFDKGGWKAFFELTVGSTNDPIKAYLDAEAELYEKSQEAEEQKREKLSWGDGFLGKEVCEEIESATGIPRKRCETMTPPSLIRDILSFRIGELPALQLLNIDEFNEVFTALGSNLTNRALKGTFGLLGLGGNSRYADNQFGDGSQSYLDALATEKTTTSVSTNNEIAQAVDAEEEYGEIQQEILDTIAELEDQLAEAEDEYGSCFDLELTDELEEDKDTAESNLEVSNLVLDVLTDLLARLRAAETSAEQSAVYSQYAELQANDLIRTDRENTQLRLEFLELEFGDRVAEFEDMIDEEEENCN